MFYINLHTYFLITVRDIGKRVYITAFTYGKNKFRGEVFIDETALYAQTQPCFNDGVAFYFRTVLIIHP